MYTIIWILKSRLLPSGKLLNSIMRTFRLTPTSSHPQYNQADGKLGLSMRLHVYDSSSLRTGFVIYLE